MELTKEELKKIGYIMTSIEIDNALWILSKNEVYKGKSYYLTKTITY